MRVDDGFRDLSAHAAMVGARPGSRAGRANGGGKPGASMLAPEISRLVLSYALGTSYSQAFAPISQSWIN
eukprot:5888239-Pyramimonas_sp.AAC.1